MNEKIDAGMFSYKKISIYLEDTLDSFIRRSKKIGAEMVIEGIEKLLMAN